MKKLLTRSADHIMRKSALYILAILLTASACNKAVVTPQQMGVVTLALASDAEAVVDTKADAIDYDSFLIDIEGTTLIGNSYSQPDLRYGDMPASMLIPFGNYTFTAESCTPAAAEEGLGRVRYEGATSDVDILTEEPVAIEIECSMANAKVTLEFDESFLEDFENPWAELVAGSRTLKLNDAEEAASSVMYFNISEDAPALEYTVHGDINGRHLTYTNAVQLSAAKWIKIVVRSNHNGQIGGPDISVDESLKDNEFTENIDPNEGETIVNGSAGLSSIRVDVTIESATVIDCTIDI